MIDFSFDEEVLLLTPVMSELQIDRLAKRIEEKGEKQKVYIYRNTVCFNINEYKACKKHDLPIDFEVVSFSDKNQLLKWVCEKQLENMNDLIEPLKKYVLGKLFNIEALKAIKFTPGSNQMSKAKLDEGVLSYRMLQQQMSDKYYISWMTVAHYGEYTKALDTVFAITPEFTKRVLRGELRLSHDNLVKLANAKAENIKTVTENLIEDSDRRDRQNRRHISKLGVEDSFEPEMKIKITPEYNPNVELDSLAFTIPTWKQSIDRVIEHGNFAEASYDAKKNLYNKVQDMMSSIYRLFTILEDNTK